MTVQTTLDRRGGVAIWRRIADVLREEIARGLYPPGSLLPGEATLARRFDVNRHTVRQAIRSMAEEGLLSPEQGRGTVVRDARLSYPIGTRTRFSEIVSRQSRTPLGTLLRSGDGVADARLAEALGLVVGAPVVELETLSSADGIPVSVATHWLAAPRFSDMPGLVARLGSITRALAACRIDDYVRRETRITAGVAAPEDAAALQIRVGAPILVSEGLNVDPGGTPTHVTRARLAAERVEIVVE